MVIHVVGYLPRNEGWNYSDIFSPYWRLIYNGKSGHRIIMPDGKVELGPDKIVLHPDNTRCDFEGQNPVPTFWLNFSCDYRPALQQQIPIELTPDRIELALIREIQKLFGDGKHEDVTRKRIHALGLALLQVVLSRQEIAWQSRTPPGITKAISHIREHPDVAHYNADLAGIAGMSERTFTRSFMEHMGVPPTQYVLQTRIRISAHLLAMSQCSLEDIAEQCGFPNAAYFSRTFKKVTGDAPSEFRKRMQHVDSRRKT